MAICTKLVGEHHESTANSLMELGVTQFTAQLYKEALQSVKRALAIYIKMTGEEHELTTNN